MLLREGGGKGRALDHHRRNQWYLGPVESPNTTTDREREAREKLGEIPFSVGAL